MQIASNIATSSSKDKGSNRNLVSNWDLTNISRLFQLRLVRWATTIGSIAGLSSLLAGAAHGDTLSFTDVGAKAFSLQTSQRSSTNFEMTSS